MPSKGILFFAHSNHEIDYGTIAVLNAVLVKKYFKRHNDIALITDERTFNYISKKFGQEFIIKLFKNIIYSDTKMYNSLSNKRLIRDTASTEVSMNWYNCDRLFSYDLSPFDETLVLDSDYLIFNNALEYVFDIQDDFLMNHTIKPLLKEHAWFIEEERVNFNSIKQYWATAFYFKKNELTKAMFEFGKFVLENYSYYKTLYQCNGSVFRNDHLFSIINHTFSGLYGAEIKSLPIPYILTSPDYDELYQFKEDGCVILAAKPNELYNFVLTNLSETNIHIMNKQSILRNANKILGGSNE